MLKDNLETNLDLYNYYLPHENIAQSPVVPRDFSKLMIYNTIEDKIIIDKFYNLHKYLNKNYFLVFNETKVLPAKVTLFKETGGNAKKIGSIAAPTASFHFTPRVLRRLKNKKIKYYFVTLHVGLATFTPLKEEYIKTKKLPPEYWEIDIEVYEKIKKLKQEGKKMIAVGTTTTRMLESLVRF
mgnify:CR=1 FL=1